MDVSRYDHSRPDVAANALALNQGSLEPAPAKASFRNRPPCTLRLVLAISLDGRLAPPDGGAAQLGGSGDRRVLEQALAWSDAALIGAGTLRVHRCTCLVHDRAFLDQRLASGRSAQPRAVVERATSTPVSRRLAFLSAAAGALVVAARRPNGTRQARAGLRSRAAIVC